MTNGARIRSYSDEMLAWFINIGRPNCNEICPDAKTVCVHLDVNINKAKMFC